MQIASKIRAMRSRAGETTEQLAKILRVSRSTISLWETGRSRPTYEHLIALSRHYDVPVNYFFEEKKSA